MDTLLLYQVELTDDKCTIVNIVNENQLLNDLEVVNVLPFVPVKLKIRNYFCPMMPKIYPGCHDLPTFQNMAAMTILPPWLKSRTGTPAAMPFLINKSKTSFEDYGLLLYNEGTILEIPAEEDIDETSLRQYGLQLWKNLNNVLDVDSRSDMQEFLAISEALPIKVGTKRLVHNETPAELDFINTCLTPGRPEDGVHNDSYTEVDTEAELIDEWKKVLKDRQDVAVRPVEGDYIDWKYNFRPNAKQVLNQIKDKLSKISFEQGTRISFNTKIQQYEAQIIDNACSLVTRLCVLQDEKEFFDICGAKEEILNHYFLPELRKAIYGECSKGIPSKEVMEKECQCEEEDLKLEESFADWSGQWSD